VIVCFDSRLAATTHHLSELGSIPSIIALIKELLKLRQTDSVEQRLHSPERVIVAFAPI
jgi:hypothetical protein